jgi:hypothetical protein
MTEISSSRGLQVMDLPNRQEVSGIYIAIIACQKKIRPLKTRHEKKDEKPFAEDSLTISAHNKNITQTELLLTEYFIRSCRKIMKTDIENIRQWRSYLPAKKESVMETAAGHAFCKKKR